LLIRPESEYSTVVSASFRAIRAVGAHNVAITGNNSSVLLRDCHHCTVVGNTGGQIALSGSCHFNSVSANAMASISVGPWCHHNAVTGNACRWRSPDLGLANVAQGDIMRGDAK